MRLWRPWRQWHNQSVWRTCRKISKRDWRTSRHRWDWIHWNFWENAAKRTSPRPPKFSNPCWTPSSPWQTTAPQMWEILPSVFFARSKSIMGWFSLRKSWSLCHRKRLMLLRQSKPWEGRKKTPGWRLKRDRPTWTSQILSPHSTTLKSRRRRLKQFPKTIKTATQWKRTPQDPHQASIQALTHRNHR